MHYVVVCAAYKQTSRAADHSRHTPVIHVIRRVTYGVQPNENHKLMVYTHRLLLSTHTLTRMTQLICAMLSAVSFFVGLTASASSTHTTTNDSTAATSSTPVEYTAPPKLLCIIQITFTHDPHYSSHALEHPRQQVAPRMRRHTQHHHRHDRHHGDRHSSKHASCLVLCAAAALACCICNKLLPG